MLVKLFMDEVEHAIRDFALAVRVTVHAQEVELSWSGWEMCYRGL